jgi:uncharacterized protein involved in response to NO
VLSVLVLALWWAIALPVVGVTAQPSTLVHALVMPLGIFPPFMLGFVFTAGPRWLGTEAPRGHFPLAIAQVLGLVAMLLGFAVGDGWALPGAFVLLVVWWWATWLWFSCIQRAPNADQRHARCILVAMMAGNLSLLLVVAWALSGDGQVWLAARDLILWGWITPIFFSVAHRMIPFFTQAAIPQRPLWRPEWVLYVWLASCIVLVLAGPSNFPLLAVLSAAVMALSTAYVAWNWLGRPWFGAAHGKLRGSCGGNRLLAMLHLSFAWLPLAFLLLALSGLGLPVQANLAAAALHAVGMGFCLTMMVGFVTRVTLGHSGKPLQATDTQWYLYLALHVLAILRVLCSLVAAPPAALHMIAALWLAVLALWAAQMLPAYWQPRADGKPG